MVNRDEMFLNNALESWYHSAKPLTSATLYPALKMYSDSPISHTHTLVVHLRWDPTITDPSTCMEVESAAVMAHDELQAYLRSRNKIPQDMDFASTLTPDGINSTPCCSTYCPANCITDASATSAVSQGMANFPKELHRALAFYIAEYKAKAGQDCFTARLNPMALEVETEIPSLHVPAWKLGENTDPGWEVTFRRRAKLSEVVFVEMPRGLRMLGTDSPYRLSERGRDMYIEPGRRSG